MVLAQGTSTVKGALTALMRRSVLQLLGLVSSGLVRRMAARISTKAELSTSSSQPSSKLTGMYIRELRRGLCGSES